MGLEPTIFAMFRTRGLTGKQRLTIRPSRPARKYVRIWSIIFAKFWGSLIDNTAVVFRGEMAVGPTGLNWV